MRLKNS